MKDNFEKATEKVKKIISDNKENKEKFFLPRPKKVINQKQFESLCAIQCTQEEICNVLEVSEKTLINWCQETYGDSFSKVFRQKKELGRMSLRRKQWELAQSGNSTMQVWLGKNILKQSDNPIQDEIKLKELELKVKEFELKEKLMLKQLEQEDNNSDIAQALRDIFGNEDNK